MYHSHHQYDPFITALNTQKSAMKWFNTLSENMTNVYTPGYREKKTTFADFVNGTRSQSLQRSMHQGASMPGRAPSNLFIEGKGFFAVRKGDGALRFTRLGDFKFNGQGTLVNERGWSVQGYLLDETGKIVNTGASNASPNANNPQHSVGGPGQVPTTEINMWVDPSNGKYFGKYDEYKVQSDGTVVGIANGGKDVDPLYKVALANFTAPENLEETEEATYIPTHGSGEPVAGTGEIRAGLLEGSNVSLKEQVSYLRQAKLQLDVASRLIQTNKSLLEEGLRLIQ